MFDELLKDSEIGALFTDEAVIRAMLRFEGALALAQASVGRIPADQARLIEQVCAAAEIDPQKIIAAAKDAGNPAIPLVKALTCLVGQANGGAAQYVHAGATSQDVIDSALMLQLKKALSELDLGLNQLQDQLIQLVREHRDTVMIGRTLLQQARPISFGLKLAGWLDQLVRCKQSLKRVREQAVVLQFGGATGTLAASGESAVAIMTKLAELLELGEPAMPWHSARDRVFEIASALTMLSGCLGKIATDAALLMQTEIAELTEEAGEGRGGSSALPHKKNPVMPTLIIAACTRIPGLCSSIAISMIQEHERAVGRWHAEWGPLADIVSLTASAVKNTVSLFSRLKVDPVRMRQNIELTRGLVYAEDVSVALATHIGKPRADQAVKLACERARAKQQHLRDVLLSDPGTIEWLDPMTLEQIFRPENALGASNELIDRVLRHAGAGRAEDLSSGGGEHQNEIPRD
jgi:3-carboxy-cis,cis-muconate cycloisomerase